MPKTNEREWELRNFLKQFIRQCPTAGTCIGCEVDLDAIIGRIRQLQLDTIARCQKEERERAANLVDKLPYEPNMWELGDCIDAIRSGVTSLNKPI